MLGGDAAQVTKVPARDLDVRSIVETKVKQPPRSDERDGFFMRVHQHCIHDRRVPRGDATSTAARQGYLVHLDFKATAVTASDAVAEALAQLRHERMSRDCCTGQRNLAVLLAAAAGPRLEVDSPVHGTWGDPCYAGVGMFRGENLG